MITYDEYKKNQPPDTDMMFMVIGFLVAICIMYFVGSATADRAVLADPGTECHLTKWCFIFDVSIIAIIMMFMRMVRSFFVCLGVGVLSSFNKDAMLFLGFPSLLVVSTILIAIRIIWGGLGIMSDKILGHK